MSRVTFVTDGLHAALEQARAAAGEQDVSIAGEASTVNQALAAGVLDEMHLHVVPIVLGPATRGRRRRSAEAGRGLASPAVTHIRYAIG